MSPNSELVIDGVVRVVPDLGQARLSGLARGLGQAPVHAAAVQEIDKILDLRDPLRRQCLEFFDKLADMVALSGQR